MTAEAQVHCELSEVSKVVMDVSSHEEVPKVGADCNGVNNPVGGVNVGGKDDPDGSYVFISANGDLIDRDLNVHGAFKFKDTDGQVLKLNGENGEISPAEANCIDEGTDVAPSVGKSLVAGVDVLVQDQFPTATVESECKLLNGDARLEEIEPDYLEQNQEYPITVLEVDRSGTPSLYDGKIKHQEQNNENSIAEPGVVRECQVLVSEVGDLHEEEEKTEKQSTKENSDLMESEEAHTVHSEPSECGSSLLDEGKLNSEGHAVIELSRELEVSQESEVMVSEATECKVPEIEIDVEVQVQLNDSKIDSEGKNYLNSTTELGEESQMLVSEVVDLRDGEEKPEKQNTATNADFRERGEAETVFLEPSKCKSSNNGDSILNPEESASIELSIEVEGSNESHVMVSDASECELPEVEITKVIAENQIELECVSPEVEITKVIAENQIELESPREVNSGTEEVNRIAKVVNETVPLEAETTDEHVLDESNESFPTHVDGDTQTQVLNEFINGCQNTSELNGSENTKSDPADCQRSEFETGSEPVGSVFCCPAEDTIVEVQYKQATVEGNIKTRYKEVSSGTESDLSVNAEGNISTSSCDEVNIQTVVYNSLDPDSHANDELQNGSGAGTRSESQVENCHLISVGDMPCSDGDLSRSEVVDSSIVNSGSEPSHVPKVLNIQDEDDQVNGGDGDSFDNHNCQNVDALDEKIVDALNEQSSDPLNERSVGVEGVKRPFNFLIRVPRFDDEKLREQIRHAQLQVNEKTHQRDAIRDDIQMTAANCQQLRDSRETARSEGRAARELLKLKRQEIDSVQSVINRVKNTISVEDMNVRINNMEHMIQHETLLLKEEKDLILQIKKLKHLREELSANMGNRDDVQQALDQRDQNEKRLKILRKELDCLKDKVSKTQATTMAAEKICNDESKKLKELHAQFRAADDVRQKAYTHMQNLKRQFYEKNMQFRKYKDDLTSAYEYASNQDKEGLHRLCVNQVETIMDLWNKDDEYQKEYLRCNMRSTRRFKTSDGHAFGPDEEPTALPNFVDDRSRPTPSKEKSELPIFTLEQEKQESNIAGEETDVKSSVKLAEEADQTANTKIPGKPALRTGVETISGRDKVEEMSGEEHKETKEEQELARKEEALRKEESAVELKEQQRLDEKAKAKEALERKRRNAEKAQIKAELRAQKEAEQKEKERQKKAKKKERKKAAVSDSNNEGETVSTSESPIIDAKEPEPEESPVTITKRPQKSFQFTSKTKSIPPPLRNRGKRRMQQWIWIFLTVVVILVLFLLGNIGFYSNLGNNLRRMRHYGY